MKAPDLMGELDKKSPKPKRKKPKTGDDVAMELEKEAARLLRYAMLLRGKDRLQLRVKK